MMFLCEKMLKLIEFLSEFRVLLFQMILNFDFLVQHGLFVSKVWESLHKSFDKVFQFGDENRICDFVFLWWVLVDKFEYPGSIFLVNFLFQNFILVLNELNVFGLFVVLFFHFSLQKLNHLKDIHVGKVGSIDQKRRTFIFLMLQWVVYSDLRYVPLVLILIGGSLQFSQLFANKHIFFVQDQWLLSFLV